MSDISKVKVGTAEYDVKDALARAELDALSARYAAMRPSSLYAVHDRFLTYDFSLQSRRGVLIREGTYIRLDMTEGGVTVHRTLEADSDRTFDLAQKMHLAADASSVRQGELNGRDFYLYLAPDGEGGTDIVVSCNSTYPNDIDPLLSALNTRKIGQFHTLCADAGAALTALIPAARGSAIAGTPMMVKECKDGDGGFHAFYLKNAAAVTGGAFYDVVTVQHPLAGFRAGDILPESVWCLTFRPFSRAEGMVYDPDTGMACDIYLQSGTGRNTKSAYGATITDVQAQTNHADDMRQTGKMLISSDEFSSAAIGSNERTNIYGSAAPVTAGGHKDTAGRRMVSAIGCEDMCGAMWQWTRDVAALGTGTAYSLITGTWEPVGNTGRISGDGQDAFGQDYNAVSALVAGGHWNAGASCGSRCRYALAARSSASAYIAGRGVSRVIRGA